MNRKTALLLLAPGFEEIEALATADVLRRLNCRVLLTGVDSLTVRGSHHISVTAETLLADAPAADAVILPGGLPGSTNLRDSQAVTALLKQYKAEGKYIAAICAAPTVLKHAGIAENTVMTGYPGCEPLAGSDDLHFTGAMTECDGTIITGKGPGASFLFAAEIARKVFGVPEQEIENVLDGMFVL